MNRCAYQHHQQQQKAALVGLGFVGEIRRGGDSFVNSSMGACPNGVVCPKPRRLVNVTTIDPINIRPSRFLHAKYVFSFLIVSFNFSFSFVYVL